MNPEETHNLRISFGKHRGELFTRLPLQYLRWMVNEGVRESDIAKAELLRRGSSQLPKVELSNHAIDRASQRLFKLWLPKKGQVGFHTWLHDLALEAYQHGKMLEESKEHRSVLLDRIKFKFAKGNFYPTLMTVYKIKQ